MVLYIIKVIGCMGVFYVFYKLLLEKENMHLFKRFYLLFAIIASIIIPSLVFIEHVMVETSSIIESAPSQTTDYDYIGIPQALQGDIVDLAPLFWSIYLLGVAYFGLRFVRNLVQILKRVIKNPNKRSIGLTYVLLRQDLPPHTFFKYIFLNKKKYELNQIPKEVLLHEATHAKQKHSIDVVLIELLQVIFWFNPLIYLFKRVIKLNHEFLADQAVFKKEQYQPTYQNTLLSYLSSDNNNSYQTKMANAINYSSIKKRFVIMQKRTSKNSKILRTSLLLPLLALLTYGFSETKRVAIPQQTKTTIVENLVDKASSQEIRTYNELAKKYNDVPIENRIIPLSDLKILEQIYRAMTSEQKEQSQPFPKCLPKNEQIGASREQMREYNSLAKKYNEMSPDHMQIKMKEVERLKYIYGLMSDKQRDDAAPFPDFPEPPPAPEAPDFPEPPKTIGNSNDLPAPPPPPAPPSPLDHIIEMAKKGAIFYYRNKKITSDRAIQLIKENDELSISSQQTNGEPPVVKISKNL